MTQIKSHIPKIRFKEFSWEWEEKKLWEVSENIKSWKSQNNDLWNYDLYWSTWIIWKCENYSNYWNYILVARVWANAWSLNLVNWKFWVTDNTLIIDLDNKTNIWFIYNFLYNFNLNKLVFGSGQPLVTWTQLKNIKFNLPSLPEQQKIASFLSSVDEKIEKIKEKKKNLEEYKKWVMQKIFSQEVRFKDEKWEEFGEWEEKKLGEIATFSKWKWLSKDDIVENWKNKCVHYWELFTKYWPKIKNIFSNTNLDGNLVFSEWNETLMPTSDVTPNWLATWSALSDKNIILWWDILIIKWEKLYNLFFSYYISSHKKDIMKLVSWSTVYHLYGSDMKKLKINLPTLKEQEKISDFLSGIDEKIEKVSDELGKMEEFKKGLLQGMFV